MTGPAIDTSIPTQEGTHGVDEAMSSIASQAIAQTIAEQTPDAPTVRDEKGRFTPKATEGETAQVPTVDSAIADLVADAGKPDETPLPESVPSTDEGPEAVVMPEGFVAVPKVEGRELATAFKVLDAEGELEVPDMQIEFTANGKTRKEPLDKVVRLAQMGVYNETREQAVQQAKQDMQASQGQLEQLRQYARQLEQDRESLLSNDEHYLTTRAKYESENTPEARMQKAQAQVQEHEQHNVFVQEAQSGSRFFDAQLAPAVETVTQALPLVSAEEIAAKLLLVSDRFKVSTRFGAIIPSSAHAQIARAMLEDVLPWAQQLQDHRESQRAESTKQSAAEIAAAKDATRKAQADAQKKTSLLTKAGRPNAGQATKDTPKPRVIVTAEDAEKAVIDDTMAAMGMQRAS